MGYALGMMVENACSMSRRSDPCNAVI